MDITLIVERLTELRDQLRTDVVAAYQDKGRRFGESRFNSWKKRACRFFDQTLPNERYELDQALSLRNVFVIGGNPKPPAHEFWNDHGERAHAYLDSLLLDIENGDFEFDIPKAPLNSVTKAPETSPPKESVFIVHGRNNEIKERTARFVEKLGFNAIILHEQANEGKTIIEKISHYSNVPFAIVLYTADDLGNIKSDALNGELNKRARQNVVFEHGYLISKIGRENVACLASDDIELPNDISGIVYITNDDWKFRLAKEMKQAGFEVDFNLII